MTSAVMDSFLHHINQQEKVLSAVLWVSLMSLFILQNLGNAWFLALLFILHSIRSAFMLLMNKDSHKNKLTQIAWVRDIMASLVIFFWFSAV